jgi:hypothetical protein
LVRQTAVMGSECPSSFTRTALFVDHLHSRTGPEVLSQTDLALLPKLVIPPADFSSVLPRVEPVTTDDEVHDAGPRQRKPSGLSRAGIPEGDDTGPLRCDRESRPPDRDVRGRTRNMADQRTVVRL